MVSIHNVKHVLIEDIDPNYDLVIVDEAHHYPADTWKVLIDHFQNAKRLFLTATPYWRGRNILPNQQIYIAYERSRRQMIDAGIIRDVEFYEVPRSNQGDETYISKFRAISAEVKRRLADHDRIDPSIFHQAMILTQTIQTINPSDTFKDAYNEGEADLRNQCETYVTGDARSTKTNFEDGHFRTIVIVNRLLEGFDNKNISVVAIARNVQPKSRVLFSQFVGRAVRTARTDDPITKAVLISHPDFKQRDNFETFDITLPDNDEADDEDEFDQKE